MNATQARSPWRLSDRTSKNWVFRSPVRTARGPTSPAKPEGRAFRTSAPVGVVAAQPPSLRQAITGS
jgi:hypothetical protein